MNIPLIEVQELTKCFGDRQNLLEKSEQVSAINGVNLTIEKRQSVGLIGESGSGKSTLGRIMAKLEEPSSGRVFYKGRDITHLTLKEARPLRKSIQMIFQNSMGVFDPSYTLGQSISEMLRNNENFSSAKRNERVEEILFEVGLDQSFAHRYAHQLSGGQRQRANIARALVLRPEFVLCDEPVSSLDSSLRKQILALLNRLRETFDLTYLYITHDIKSVPYVCDVMVVFYAGKIMEKLDLKTHCVDQCQHPYTRLLLDSMPPASPRDRRLLVKEQPRTLSMIPDHKSCCRFYERCPYAREICHQRTPELREIDPGHEIACHLIKEIKDP